MVVPGECLVRGEVAVPVGEVEQAEGEREEDPGGGVDLGGAVRRALPRSLYLPLPTVALHQTAPFYLQQGFCINDVIKAGISLAKISFIGAESAV